MLIKRHRIMFAAPMFLFAAALILFLLFYKGVIIWNSPSEKHYPVRGVDVSSYQGEIDWQVLSGQNIRFAFIKATEGSTYTDRCFNANFEGAIAAGLRVGAYHFFSYDSSGSEQAAHFIDTVPIAERMLPPVVDVEFYGTYSDAPAAADHVLPELTVLLDTLEAHYGMKPLLYATGKAYNLYIAEHFPENGIWIRDILKKPSLSDGREWIFWQYTDREKLDGYNGKEQFIDMNVFYGSMDEFENYP